MKKFTVMFLVLVLNVPFPARAASVPKNIYPPYFLRSGDKIPTAGLSNPGDLVLGPDGKPLGVREYQYPPDSTVMRKLADPDLFVEIKQAKHSERIVQQFYWHQSEGLDYCHYRDLEGNNWYGWNKDDSFNWVLWHGKRYWWRDPFAGNWLYYFQGYWWRAEGQNPQGIQVIVEGEYYLCDRSGKILQDMGQDGKGAIISASGVYQGDLGRGGRQGVRSGGRGNRSGVPGSRHGNHSDHSGAPDGPAGHPHDNQPGSI